MTKPKQQNQMYSILGFHGKRMQLLVYRMNQNQMDTNYLCNEECVMSVVNLGIPSMGDSSETSFN